MIQLNNGDIPHIRMDMDTNTVTNIEFKNGQSIQPPESNKY